MFTVYLASRKCYSTVCHGMGDCGICSPQGEMLGITPGCDSTEGVEL